MKEKVKFKALSGWLKTAVILMWIMGGIYSLLFLVGFIQVLLV